MFFHPNNANIILYKECTKVNRNLMFNMAKGIYEIEILYIIVDVPYLTVKDITQSVNGT